MKIDNYKILSREEEKELFQRYNQGDNAAKEKIIKHNLRLVASLASCYTDKEEFNDLFQVGCEGLMKAVERFDHTRGNKFSTYATWWIKAKMNRYIENYSKKVRIPVYLWEKARDIWDCITRYKNEHNEKPTNEEIQEITGYTIETIVRAKEKFFKLKDENIMSLYNEDYYKCLADYDEDKMMIQHDIKKAIKKLDAREKLSVKLRFGLEDDRKRTFEEVGKQLGVSRQRAHKILERILEKLEEDLEDYR